MASPQESITTVNGRRCTRSRARTAATSILTAQGPAVVTPTEANTSTTAEEAPLVQTSGAEAPPPPPPPPSSPAAAPPPPSTVAEEPVAAPTTTQVAVSSEIGVPLQSSVSLSPPAPFFTAPGAADSAILQTSLIVEPSRIDTPSEPTSGNTPVATQPRPQPTTTPVSSIPTGNPASGLIGPEQGGSKSDGGLTIPSSGEANIGSIAGGVVGGVAGLALICALLFFCLRKRKTRMPGWAEKNVERPRFLEKVRGKATGVGVMFANYKGTKKGSARNSHHRHSQQHSISSRCSTPKSQGFYAQEEFTKRPSSRNSERNRLRKKNSSVFSQSKISGILGESEKSADNPFADPEPPRILRLSNPDSTLRGLLTPQPVITSDHPSRVPFASPFEDPTLLVSVQKYHRTQSQASALSSHPPSFIFPTRPQATNKDSIGPLLPIPVSLPAEKRRSSMAFPTFDVTSTAASGGSDHTSSGEPGPSRPATRLFTPRTVTGRTVRQSDPFDLDRPEVLGFGNVLGRKDVRGSVSRQPMRGKRTSSTGNWTTVNDGPQFSWNVVRR
ncbi:hypothetical protein BDU57DRAFT_516293 [Ampelomyces quisqualis]|uniref:Uncharacterized protein n=1 Tax=Ampelomyces quisqualis TaxID=50730 RepID=A0A6A5QLJ9_AMPQU|nr:hypothetical protein BDU57DRAFT_516293 [Ampelomyces quisqualis]